MRILFVIPYFYPAQAFGGPVSVAFNMGKELVKRGHEVVVLTSDAKDLENRLNVESNEIEGMKVYYLRNLSMFFVKNSKFFITSKLTSRMVSEIKSLDIIHTHEYRTFQNIVVHKLAKKYRVPYILQAHGSLPRIGRQFRKVFYDLLIGQRILRGASKVIALSYTEVQQYRNMGVPEEKIAIIPNGIDLSRYANLPPRGSFRKKFSFDEDEKIVLYLGRIHRIKGIDILVKAFEKVVEKSKDVKLVVVGPDDGYLSEFQALTRALKIEDNVLICGPLWSEDKLEAYVDADVYVLPSRYETFPMSALESIACGTPVILTDKCGVAKFFENEVGLVVKPCQNGLAKAILEMLQNNKIYGAFRRNCGSFIEEFNLSKTTSMLEQVYELSMRARELEPIKQYQLAKEYTNT